VFTTWLVHPPNRYAWVWSPTSALWCAAGAG
jgi:hypothetical protein